ncbi:sulfur carrier protein ThiS [Bartonella sp. LJL80]
MKLSVNGEFIETTAENLANLLEQLDYHGEWLATAVNAEVISAEDRVSCQLHDGDRIEILSPMQGG